MGINGDPIENNRETLLYYKDITEALNKFQRLNTAKIKQQEEADEQELRESCSIFFRMLDYLDAHYDEE